MNNLERTVGVMFERTLIPVLFLSCGILTLIGLVTSYVQTAFYNTFLKER